MTEKEVHTVGAKARCPRHQNKQRTHQQRQKEKTSTKNCGHCGSEQCPVKGRTCNACGKQNHFASVCRSKNFKKKVHAVSGENELVTDYCGDNNGTDYCIDMVNMLSNSPDRAFTQTEVGPSRIPIRLKIDIGSSAVVLPLHDYIKLKLELPIRPPDNQLTSYTGNALSVKGMITLSLRHKNKVTESVSYIVDSDATPFLSLQASIDLGLIKLTYSVESSKLASSTVLDKGQVMKEYGDLFKGIGVIPGVSFAFKAKCSARNQPS
jgi:hypothetical protein